MEKFESQNLQKRNAQYLTQVIIDFKALKQLTPTPTYDFEENCFLAKITFTFLFVHFIIALLKRFLMT